MYKYGLSKKEFDKRKEKLREQFILDSDEEVPDEVVLVDWNPEPTEKDGAIAKMLGKQEELL